MHKPRIKQTEVQVPFISIEATEKHLKDHLKKDEAPVASEKIENLEEEIS